MEASDRRTEESERRRRAAREASDWFTRLEAGQMDRGEREQFVRWLRESHVHVAEMLRMEQIDKAFRHYPHWARVSTGPKSDADNDIVVPFPAPPEGDSQTTSQLPPRTPPSPSRRSGHGLTLLAVAATVLLVLGTLTVLPRIRGHVIETERGQRQEVVLADGSVLQVDPQTRLRVKYTDTVRRIFLERGRELFHVAKNPNRPFLVEADDTTVRAVGTAFGVEHRAQGVLVTVSEGKVAVFPTSSAAFPAEATHLATPSASVAATPKPRKAEGPKLFLTANQQVTVGGSGSAEPVREVDSASALAWAEGRLIFQNKEVGEAVAEINRYTRVQLTVTDPVLARKLVNGVFKVAEPETFIAFLQSAMPVEVIRNGDTSITIGPARDPP